MFWSKDNSDLIANLITERDEERARRIIAENRASFYEEALATARASASRFEAAYIEATSARMRSLDELNSTMMRQLDTNQPSAPVERQPLEVHPKPSPAKVMFNRLMTHEIRQNRPVTAETKVS